MGGDATIPITKTENSDHTEVTKSSVDKVGTFSFEDGHDDKVVSRKKCSPETNKAVVKPPHLNSKIFEGKEGSRHSPEKCYSKFEITKKPGPGAVINYRIVSHNYTMVPGHIFNESERVSSTGRM